MGVLLMLMTIGGLVVAAILLAFSLMTKKAWLTKFTIGGVAVWYAFYTVMLLGFSFVSTEKTLAMNEPKAFCGFYLDCHVHAVVTGVRTAKTIGDQTAKGKFYVVTLKVFSDAKNPNIAFRLLEPKARIVLPAGEKLERDTKAEGLLPTSTVDLGRDIKGGQTIEKEIVFDVAEPLKGIKLLVTEGYGIDKTIEHVLIDDEDSLFHAQTFFDIAEKSEKAGL